MRYLLALLTLFASPVAAQSVVLKDAITNSPYRADQSQSDARVLAGFGYTVSTAVVAVSATNYLNAIIQNNANSGVNFVFSSRILACNLAGGTTPNEYGRFTSATAAFPATPTPTSVAIGNRITTGAAAPGTFQYQMSAAPLTGTQSSAGFLPTGGVRLEIREIVIVPPGGKLAYTIGGAGGGLAAMARCSMTFLFYTVPV